jgi:hypothetical protein
VNSTPAEDYQVERAIYYNNTGLASYVSDSGWSTLTQNTESYAAAKARVEDYIRGGTYGKLPCTFAIVRTEELAFDGLLDTYTGAAAAYSLRCLRSAYLDSPAIRVRRASDNAEQDIGFDGNGDLDTTALATFCSGTDGFVKVWYDQSGNGNDATQTTTADQPKIYDSSTGVVTENGKPAVLLARDGVNRWRMDISSPIVSSNDLSSFLLAYDKAYTRMLAGTSGRYTTQLGGAWDGVTITGGSTTTLTEMALVSMLKTSTTASYYLNSDLEFSDTCGTTITISNFDLFPNTSIGIIPIQEVVIYASGQSTNRTGIEDNINGYFDIY